MIRFSCPTCGRSLEHPTPGAKLACPCGQRVQVPGSPKTVLGTIDPPASPAPPIPFVEPAAGEITTVRFICGSNSRRFRTDRPAKVVRRALLDALDRVNIGKDGGSELAGKVPNSWEAFCTSSADGFVKHRTDRNEYLVEISLRCNLTALTIILIIFLFPIGLIALALPQMVRSEAERKVAETFRWLQDELEDAR